MADHEHYQELISLQLDGMLDDAGEAELRAHLESCPDCRELLDLLTGARAALDVDLEPPEALRRGVMSGVKRINAHRRALRRSVWGAGAGFLAAAAVLAVAILPGTWKDAKQNVAAPDNAPDVASFADPDPREAIPEDPEDGDQPMLGTPFSLPMPETDDTPSEDPAPGDIPVPETPAVPDTPETPEPPTAPETPAVPESPQVPETPEAPAEPEAPVEPEEPESPAAAIGPEDPAVIPPLSALVYEDVDQVAGDYDAVAYLDELTQPELDSARAVLWFADGSRGYALDAEALAELELRALRVDYTPENGTGLVLAVVGASRPEPADDEIVLVRDYIPNICVDLKYATDDNFMGQAVYDFTEARLRYGTVKKLMAVQAELNEQGYGLLIWDALRPVSAQFKLWEVCPDSTFVANPNRGVSNHSRGNTVDITLIALDGSEVEMPSPFDTFTAAADRDYSDVSETAAANALLLENTMKAHGFKPYSAEWWHFADSVSYPAVED